MFEEETGGRAKRICAKQAWFSGMGTARMRRRRTHDADEEDASKSTHCGVNMTAASKCFQSACLYGQGP